MKIAVITRDLLSLQHKTGLAVYTEQMLIALAKIDSINQYIIYEQSPNKINSDILSAENFSVKSSKWLFPFGWTQLRLPLSLLKDRPDIIYSPSFRLPLWGSKKTIVTIHDLFVLDYSSQYPFWFRVGFGFWLKLAAKRALKIVVVSQFTKGEICSKLGVREDKIEVIYPGYNKEDFHTNNTIKDGEVLKKFSITKPYLLQVAGNFIERKNCLRVIAAFKEFHKLKPEYLLVLVGQNQANQKSSYGQKLYKLLNEMKSSVKVTGFVQNEELSALYRQSSGVLYPSIAEGFGFPVLEAMACGAPVITSNQGSTSEIAQGAAILVDPFKVNEIKEAMETIVTRESAAELITSGKTRVNDFDWSNSAKKLLELFSKVSR